VLNSNVATEYLGGSEFAYFGLTASNGGSDTEQKVQVTSVQASFEGGATNNPPIAIDDVATTSVDIAVDVDVLANDTDINSDTISIQSFTQAANGTVSLNPDGTLSYTPNAGFTGADNFTYTASDGVDESAPATVTVTVSLDDPFA